MKTYFEQLRDSLNVKANSEHEKALISIVNSLIFDTTHTYTDEEINEIATAKFRKYFPYV